MDETTEKLTRLLSIERLKKLSDMYVELSKQEPTASLILQLNQINAERISLRDQFMKVVDCEHVSSTSKRTD